ncbi:pre-toxin TG domain-containing protein [Lysinibacillus sp. JNUCC 51]|uniref:pre-toxin TG domain-containing protein n=1 Tax=Lysinibacillus sp. JNUCC-51 TaxID=2792479 RepID=UPI001937AE2E|nr:hypothetical protein JNUCC51_20200 [Lysinibacillus sp. JNUCC-51]
MAKKGKGFFGAVGSFLGSIPVVKKVKKAAKSVKKKLKKAKKKLKKALKKAKKKLKKKLGKVLTKARKLKNNLSKSKLVKRFKKAVKKAVKKAKKYVKKVVKTVKKAVKTAVKAVKKAVKTTVKAVKKAAKTTVKAVKTAAKTTVKAVKTAAKTTVKAVKTATKAAVQTVKTATKTIVQAKKNDVNVATKKASNATKAAVKQIKKNETAQNLKLVSMGLNYIPVFGNIKSLYEMATGKDMITGQKVENSRARYTNLKNSCPAPKTYSVHDGEPKTTLADLRKVLSVPSTVNPDGLAPFTVIGANIAYALLFEDIVKYGNPNSTLREQNEATLSLISPFGKAGKVKKGMEALKDMEKGLEAARDLANNANKVEKTHHTQKEIQEVGEYSKKLLDKGTGEFDVASFEKNINHMNVNEKVALIKTTAIDIANQRGWKKDSKLTKLNGGRTVYYDNKTGNYYALDTQHGRFEVVNKKGKHQGEVDFNLNPTKPADKSGGHDLKVK